MKDNLDEKLIKNCYKALRLDERASKKEVELAYEVLTKKSNSPSLVENELSVLRACYEFLMCKVYGECDKNENNNDEKIENNINEDENHQIYIDILSETPINIKNALDYIQEYTGETYSDKARALFSVQNVSLPLLGHALLTNGVKFGNLRIYNDADLNNIISQSCQNKILYYNATFELNAICPLKDNLNDIRQFVNKLKKIKYNDEIICLKFEVENTPRGIIGNVIAIPTLIDELEILLKNKAVQSNFNLNMTVRD